MLPAKAQAVATKEPKEAAPEVTSAEMSDIEATEEAEWNETAVAKETEDTASVKDEAPQTPEEIEAQEEADTDDNWGDELDVPAEPETSKESSDEGETSPEAAEETVTESADKGDVTNIDPHLLTGARQLGFSDEDSGKLHEAGLLENVMTRVLAQSRAPLSRTPAAETPEKAPDTIEPDADLYDEETIGKINAQNAVVEKQNKEINALREENIQREIEYTQREFSDFLSKLGDDWVPVFGKGHVEQGTAAFVNRTLLINKASEQAAGLEVTGNYQNVPLSAVFDQGLRMAFPEHQTKLATDKLSAQVKSRAKQFISKPGTTKKAALSPDETAMQAIQKIADDRGINLGDDAEVNDNWGGD